MAELLFFARGLVLAFFIFVGAVEDGAEATAVQCRTVDHVGIFLVVPRVGHDGNDNVLSSRQGLRAIKPAHVGRYHGLFGVTEDVTHGVKTLAEVQGVNAHGLLAHRGLIRITRRLIVVREGDVGGSGTQNDTGMDFTVRRGRIRTRLGVIHRNERIVRLAGIDVLKQVLAIRSLPSQQVVPLLNFHDLSGQRARFVSVNLTNGGCIVNRSNHATRLRANPQLFKGILPNNTRI